MVGAHHGPLIDRAFRARRLNTLGVFGGRRYGLRPAHRARGLQFVPFFETLGVKHVVTRRLAGFALVERGIAHGALHRRGGGFCGRVKTLTGRDDGCGQNIALKRWYGLHEG